MPTPDPGALFPLPEVDDAPHVCVTLSIPGDQESISNFVGALYRLALWNNYRRDDQRRGKKIARVWRDVIEKIDFGSCTVSPTLLDGIWEDFDMPIRVDCDCRIWVTCCDGTEVELATVGMINQPTQPGGGTPQPTPGGCKNYTAKWQANSQWLVPVLVNTGDTLTFANASGSGSPGGLDPFWYCPNGQTFFGGQCVGIPGVKTADPFNTIPHMRLIAVIAGVGYRADEGTITVPAGVVDEQVVIYANDDDISNNPGSYSLDVTVCNNSLPGWSHTLNLKLDNYGFIPFDGGAWIAGFGLISSQVDGSPHNGQQMAMSMDFPQDVIVTHLKVIFDTTLGSHGGTVYEDLITVDSGGTGTVRDTLAPPTTGTEQSMAYDGSLTIRKVQLVGVMDVTNTPDPTDGQWNVYTLEIAGSGFDPFA